MNIPITTAEIVAWAFDCEVADLDHDVRAKADADQAMRDGVFDNVLTGLQRMPPDEREQQAEETRVAP